MAARGAEAEERGDAGARRRWVAPALIGVIIVGGFCVLVPLGLVVFLSPAGNGAREWVMGETPEAKIAAYMRAIKRGDREAALGAWELGAPQQPHYDALGQRHAQVTDELLALSVRDWRALETEWWTTCCEPHVTCNGRNAGGARVRVQMTDSQGKPQGYVFDVFTREQPYWGGAMGNPFRRWAIRDVYPEGEEPLYWRWVYEAETRYLR